MSTTHVAGPAICISGRILQRCAICGHKLCDSLNTAVPSSSIGTVPEFPTWREGDYVQEDGNRSSVVGYFPSSPPVPEVTDLCLDLVE
jgi:hypothetical protein